jgi:DNA polymerase
MSGFAARSMAVATGVDRQGTMSEPIGAVSAADFLPDSRSLAQLRRAAADCRGCRLYRRATQTVFGEGSRRATIMLVGEQPGDQEDLTGHPFVGPSGRLLDEVLAQVGIERREVYVTNMVKHFKWSPRGKRRLHSKPNARELAACRPWLEAELEAVTPLVVVCLGATAAQGLLGRGFRITRQRGKILDFSHEHARWILATYHPSAVLRAPDPSARHKLRREFTHDLRIVARKVRASLRTRAAR